jgi:hypothetical protein
LGPVWEGSRRLRLQHCSATVVRSRRSHPNLAPWAPCYRVLVSERGGREEGEAAPRYSSATGGGAALMEPVGALPKRALILSPWITWQPTRVRPPPELAEVLCRRPAEGVRQGTRFSFRATRKPQSDHRSPPAPTRPAPATSAPIHGHPLPPPPAQAGRRRRRRVVPPRRQ